MYENSRSTPSGSPFLLKASYHCRFMETPRASRCEKEGVGSHGRFMETKRNSTQEDHPRTRKWLITMVDTVDGSEIRQTHQLRER